MYHTYLITLFLFDQFNKNEDYTCKKIHSVIACLLTTIISMCYLYV